jgi:RHH-type transcriptional regulator, rel operon repressor / antitoxin RelB
MHYIARQRERAMPTAPKDGQISLRLPSELKERMATYAQLTGRSNSHVAMEALHEYLARRTPQIEDLKAAVQAADAGEFASDDEVRAVFERYATAPTAARKAPAKTGRPASGNVTTVPRRRRA